MEARMLDGFVELESRWPVDGLARLLARSGDHEPFVYLDGHSYPDPYGSFDWLVAWEGDIVPAFGLDSLYQEWAKDPGWILGYLGYDLKNEVEELTSQNPDPIGFPELLFFRPENILIGLEGKVFYKGPHTSAVILEWVRSIQPIESWDGHIELKQGVEKDDYLEAVDGLKAHIQRGDIYEVNYCIPFNGKGPMDPARVFKGLNEIANAPFSAYMSWKDGAIMSASPERYLAKRDRLLVSQPIKGTAPRSRDPILDKANANYLTRSVKERAENVMIVDLVRNDLSRVASKGSVNVPELFGVYKYPTVHQMISTIEATLKEGLNWMDAIKASFPMGSMTGAPKVSAMKLIEKAEVFKRTVYSGAIGYITPGGDMDLNVVIRTLLYNKRTFSILAGVGSAITTLADPLEEYKECQLKIKALRQALDPHPGSRSQNG